MRVKQPITNINIEMKFKAMSENVKITFIPQYNSEFSNFKSVMKKIANESKRIKKACIINEW